MAATTNFIESAIGPLAVTTTPVDSYDIDDFCRDMTISQATHLQLIRKISMTDPRYAAGRPVVTVGGVTIGGV
jgi:hypothetical protein